MIPLIKSTFYNEKETKEKLIKFISNADHLSFGKECERFENRFAKWQGRKYCVLVNSGSSANLALIQALLNLGKLKKGDSVGFSTLTWSTNVMPLIQLGLEPVPIDVELDTLNVSSDSLRNVINKSNMKVMFLTNLLGLCDDIDEIKILCDEKKIILLEDNCESLGTVYKGKKLGNFGLASTFSFYVGHHMSTIEGGAICTDNEELATMLRLVRAHGWDRNLSKSNQNKLRNTHKINSEFYSRYSFYDLGYNLRPTEINGYLGNDQLRYLDKIIDKRNRNFLKIMNGIFKNEKYFPIKYSHIEYVSSFAIPIICRTKEIRDILVAKCADKIEIRPIVGGNIARQPFFRKHIKGIRFENPNASLIHDQGFYFGNNPELTNKEISFIIKTLI